VPRNAWAPRLLSVAACIVATPALAQTVSDRSPLDTVPGQSELDFQDQVPGVRAGAFNMHASAGTSLAYDSNVLAQSSQRTEKALSIDEAQMHATNDMNEATLDLQAFARARRFIDAHELDTTEFGGAMGFDAPVGAQDELTASVRAQRGFEPHTDIETPRALPVSVYDDARADLAYTHVFNRLTLRGAASGEWLNYHDPSQHFRDLETNRDELRGEYTLGNDLSAVVTGYYGHDDFSHSSPYVASATTKGTLVGAHLSVPEVVDFELTAGYFERRYADNLGQSSGVSVRGSLIWQPTRLMTVRGAITREDQPTRIPGAFGKARTDATLELDHAYSRNLSLYARGELVVDDFNFIQRVDHTYLGEVGLTILVARPYLLKVAYEFGSRSSNAPDVSYVRHVASISLIGRL
jgi:hypothetical protein